MPRLGMLSLLARREILVLRRSRAARAAVLVLFVVAWAPSLLLPLRSGAFGLASLEDTLPLLLALAAVTVPLIGLLGGAEMLAGEIEDGTLVTIVTTGPTRDEILAGRSLGRAATLSLGLLLAFASLGAVSVLAGRGAGLGAWSCVVGLLWALGLVTGAVGICLGARPGGRLRALGSALALWVLLVFVVDGLLLAAVVATAPEASVAIGEHGHGEVETPSSETGPSLAWISVASPVSLFRTTALSAAPVLPDVVNSAGASHQLRAWQAAPAWAAWLLFPLGLALRRFRRTSLF